MAAAASVTIEGLDKLLKAARKENLVDGPMRLMLEDIGKIGVQAARSKAPKGPTGETAGNLTHQVRARSVAVKTEARATPRRPGARKGKTRYPFNYAARVNYDPKSKHNRWLNKAVGGSQVRKAAERYIKEVERRWGA